LLRTLKLPTVVKVEELNISILEIELVKQLESKLITLENFNLNLNKSFDEASGLSWGFVVFGD